MYGYLLENDDIVTDKSFTNYFTQFVKAVTEQNRAEFRSVSKKYPNQFLIEYAVPAEDCGDCEDLGVTEGLCEGHNGYAHSDIIKFSTVEIFI